MYRLALVVLALLSFAPAASAKEPRWLKDARAREARQLEKASVRSTDGYFTATIPGKVLNEVTENDGTYLISLNIGSEVPMTCEIFVESFGLAEMLHTASELTFKDIEQNVGKIEARLVERTDAGVIAASPFLAADWVYRVNDGKTVMVGGLKQIAAVKDGHDLYCAHVDLGYSKTFQDVTRSFVESVRFAETLSNPYFVEISTASLGEARVGVMVVTMERDAEGDSKVVASTSLALRVTPDTLRTHDSVHVQWVRPDGSLINASHVNGLNGEVEAALALTPDEEGEWRVKGEFKGKTIDQALTPNRAPASWIEISHARRKLFERENVVGTQLTAEQWTDLDLTRLLESRTTVLKVLDGERLSVQESLGGVTVEHVLDKSTGTPVRTVMPVGPVSIELERVYIQGSF